MDAAVGEDVVVVDDVGSKRVEAAAAVAAVWSRNRGHRRVNVHL